MLEYAKREFILTSDQIKRETQSFCDHFHSSSTRNARKVDWGKAWQLWMRRTDGQERTRQLNQRKADERFQKRFGGNEAVKKTPDYDWQQRPDVYRKIPPKNWIDGISKSDPNGRWPEEKFGPYIDDPDCLMPDEVKDWCREQFGEKYLNGGNNER